MNDTISRQAAIDAILEINDYGNSDRANALGLAEFKITTLPTAERKGHWINRNGNNIYPFWERYKCSVCGGNSNNSDYCPSCGAKMEGE